MTPEEKKAKQLEHLAKIRVLAQQTRQENARLKAAEKERQKEERAKALAALDAKKPAATQQQPGTKEKQVKFEAEKKTPKPAKLKKVIEVSESDSEDDPPPSPVSSASSEEILVRPVKREKVQQAPPPQPPPPAITAQPVSTGLRQHPYLDAGLAAFRGMVR